MADSKEMARPFEVGPGTRELSRNIEDYPGGIVIPIDKPYRWTSADVIRKVKYAAIRHFGKRNLKVGHAGTLDPLATGILIVCIGNATKTAQNLQGHDKEYVAGISFGATTPSYDLEKDPDRRFPYEHITGELLRENLRSFLGEQEQVAPLFSAKSVDGVRAYELARKLYKRQHGRGAQQTLSASALGPDDVPPRGTADDPAEGTADDTVLSGNEGTLPGGVFDKAAGDLIRTSKIRISEIELLSFLPAGNTVVKDRRSECPEIGSTIPAVVGKDVVKGKGMGDNSNEIYTVGAGVNGKTTAGVVVSGAGEKSNGGTTTGAGASGRINVADTSALGLPHADIRIVCSKGTYIRAFARDLGEALGSGAHLDSLRRTRNGPFSITTAVPLPSVLTLLA